jgi:hypothetical protein
MNSKIQQKIFELNGLVFSGQNEDGEDEYIGTDQKWANASNEWINYLDHDCKKSPDSGCAICKKYEN